MTINRKQHNGQRQHHEALTPRLKVSDTILSAHLALNTLLCQNDIDTLAAQMSAAADDTERRDILALWYDWREAQHNATAAAANDNWARRNCAPAGLLVVWAMQARADMLRDQIEARQLALLADVAGGGEKE